MQDNQLAYDFTVSIDSSPTQNTPKITPQDEHMARAGAGLPLADILTSNLPTTCLQDGHIGLFIEFMGSDFLSLYFEF